MSGDLVLITGATGTIGFRTLVALLEEGYSARVAVRSQASFDRIKSLAPVQPYLSRIDTIFVPDITLTGAYDQAVKGVKHVLHIASPTFATTDEMDFDLEVIQPAVAGTVGMLESAAKEKGIKRVVITSSALSLASLPDLLSGQIVKESHRTPGPSEPYDAFLMAYVASKITSFNNTEKWMTEHQPSFKVVNIQPSYVIGRDDTVTDAKEIVKGTNALLIGPLLGYTSEPSFGSCVHIDDVARMHVRSLSCTIPGNQNYLATANPPDGIEWADAFKVVKKHFPAQCAVGIFKVDTALPPKSIPCKIDSSLAEKTFGFTFKSFEEQVLSVATHYLELLDKV